MVSTEPKKRDFTHREYDQQSPYVAKLEDRSKVNVALWGSSGGKKPKCDLCKQTLVTPTNETFMVCPMCGKKTTAEEIKDKQTKTLTATTTKTGSIIISQKKTKRGNSLESNDNEGLTEDELAQLGVAGVTFKDYFP